MPFKGSVPLYVMVHKGSGNFELCQGNSLLVSGTVKSPELKDNLIDLSDFNKYSEDIFTSQIDLDDIYKEFNYRGYEYSGIFKTISNLKLSDQCKCLFLFTLSFLKKVLVISYTVSKKSLFQNQIFRTNNNRCENIF